MGELDVAGFMLRNGSGSRGVSWQEEKRGPRDFFSLTWDGLLEEGESPEIRRSDHDSLIYRLRFRGGGRASGLGLSKMCGMANLPTRQLWQKCVCFWCSAHGRK